MPTPNPETRVVGYVTLVRVATAAHDELYLHDSERTYRLRVDPRGGEESLLEGLGYGPEHRILAIGRVETTSPLPTFRAVHFEPVQAAEESRD